MAEVDWTFEESERRAINEIMKDFSESENVRSRKKRNVNPKKIEISRSEFWEAHLFAQLTSAQRSSPKSPVQEFDKGKLSLKSCKDSNDVEDFVSTKLEKFGGIRFYNKIGEACNKNLNLLESEIGNGNTGWDVLDGKLKKLIKARRRKPKVADADLERKICYFLYDELGGEGFHRIGPKQSRNLLQALGLTRYEIPLDTRISKWVNEELNLPYHLSSKALSNTAFYDFNLDIIQTLCLDVEVLPCMFDAAVFTSYD